LVIGGLKPGNILKQICPCFPGLLDKNPPMNQEITLQNIYIELKRDQHSKTYFLIHDKDTNFAYFAFHWKVKKGWFDLETN
jgi:hypothetical protein